MEAERPKYGFEELEVYKSAREFRAKMYALTKELPAHEKFNLVSQIRRASVSLTNNIAEGHGRFHYQENIQFIRQSRGSLEELIDDLNICHDEKYIDESKIIELKNEAYTLLKRINGYIVYLQNQKRQQNE
ncbi:MAG: four helix bundle protein [Ignavibacteriae bacterium]|nr:four helix bundle protein [Ignavibacteriota bacterium]